MPRVCLSAAERAHGLRHLAGEGVHVGVVPVGGLIRNGAAEAVVLSAGEEFAEFALEALTRSRSTRTTSPRSSGPHPHA
jgi:hypothetical protein